MTERLESRLQAIQNMDLSCQAFAAHDPAGNDKGSQDEPPRYERKRDTDESRVDKCADSLSVKGTLKYAKNLTVPEEPISIMLYRDLRDSVPLTDIPLYVGRSDDSGVFSVNNLKADVYKVFALKDGNYNFIFDLTTEEIGLMDSSLIVNA